METEVTPEEKAYLNIRGQAQGLKQLLRDVMIPEMAGDVNVERFGRFFHDLRSRRQIIRDTTQVAGIVAVSRRLRNDGGYDLAAEVQAWDALVTTAMATFKSLLPEDTAGNIQEKRLNRSTELYEFNTIAAADMSPLVAELQAIVDATND